MREGDILILTRCIWLVLWYGYGDCSSGCSAFFSLLVDGRVGVYVLGTALRSSHVHEWWRWEQGWMRVDVLGVLYG